MYDADFEHRKDVWVIEEIDKLFKKLHQQNLKIIELERAISQMDNELQRATRAIDDLRNSLCKY